VLDVDCKAHELDNLYVTDASFFPSIGAVNPTLTDHRQCVAGRGPVDRADGLTRSAVAFSGAIAPPATDAAPSRSLRR